jgi:hypothetical protein
LMQQEKAVRTTRDPALDILCRRLEFALHVYIQAEKIFKL